MRYRPAFDLVLAVALVTLVAAHQRLPWTDGKLTLALFFVLSAALLASIFGGYRTASGLGLIGMAFGGLGRSLPMVVGALGLAAGLAGDRVAYAIPVLGSLKLQAQAFLHELAPFDQTWWAALDRIF